MNTASSLRPMRRVAAIIGTCIAAAILVGCARPLLSARRPDRPAPNISIPEHLDSLDVHYVSWSHDGQWLAFTATYNKVIGIYVARADGSQLRRVTDESMHAAQSTLSWLPRDQGLFFLGSRMDSVRFFNMRQDGSDLTELPDATVHAVDGDLSPDGTRIVFVSTIDRKHSQLFVRNTDGTHVRQLTNTAGGIGVNANPAWSPNGRAVIFDSIRDTTGNGAIYRINADGTDERKLTSSAVNNAMPRWSPDGRHISWVQVANRRATLVEAESDGSHFRKVADDILAGTYSPDGLRIASSGRADDPKHWFAVLIRTDGTDKQRLVLRPAAQ